MPWKLASGGSVLRPKTLLARVLLRETLLDSLRWGKVRVSRSRRTEEPFAVPCKVPSSSKATKPAMNVLMARLSAAERAVKATRLGFRV